MDVQNKNVPWRSVFCTAVANYIVNYFVETAEELITRTILFAEDSFIESANYLAVVINLSR